MRAVWAVGKSESKNKLRNGVRGRMLDLGFSWTMKTTIQLQYSVLPPTYCGESAVLSLCDRIPAWSTRGSRSRGLTLAYSMGVNLCWLQHDQASIGAAHTAYGILRVTDVQTAQFLAPAPGIPSVLATELATRCEKWKTQHHRRSKSGAKTLMTAAGVRGWALPLGHNHDAVVIAVKYNGKYYRQAAGRVVRLNEQGGKKAAPNVSEELSHGVDVHAFQHTVRTILKRNRRSAVPRAALQHPFMDELRRAEGNSLRVEMALAAFPVDSVLLDNRGTVVMVVKHDGKYYNWLVLFAMGYRKIICPVPQSLHPTYPLDPSCHLSSLSCFNTRPRRLREGSEQTRQFSTKNKQHSLRVVVTAAALSIAVLAGAASEAACAGFWLLSPKSRGCVAGGAAAGGSEHQHTLLKCLQHMHGGGCEGIDISGSAGACAAATASIK
ncbi:hypothetical protein BJV74DRAFT_794304 [Russula compacta]|nr:hypothetical protein BJV74DRAFT_794304 [Russula compacta]